MRTAILIDGAFFLKRYHRLKGNRSPSEAARDLHWMCREHLVKRPKAPHSEQQRRAQLYRIFFYDCPPLAKKAHNPATREAVDFSKSKLAVWRRDFHHELKTLRKVALRLGTSTIARGDGRSRPRC